MVRYLDEATANVALDDLKVIENHYTLWQEQRELQFFHLVTSEGQETDEIDDIKQKNDNNKQIKK